MVNSISKVTQILIDNDLSILDALQRGYANYSAVARLLKTKVEKILGYEIKLESLITSVKRSRADYRVLYGDITEIIAGSVINLRTDVAKISIDKTKYTLKTVRKTLLELPEKFFQIIEGTSAITIIFDQNLFTYIYKILRKEEILDEKQNLASITINSPKEIIDTQDVL